MAAPVATADDPLAPIKAAVNGDRSRTACPPLTYDSTLEGIAQTAVRQKVPMPIGNGGYGGTVLITQGISDPEDQAINATYQGGAGDAISNCSYADFGVGFYREGYAELDAVGIVFGARAKQPSPAPNPTPDPTLTPTPAVQQCPAGSPTPTVPAFGTCAPVPAPTDKVTVSFAKGIQWTVNVASTADISGKCTYAATNPILPGSNKSFDIAARGSASFTVLAPPPFSTYHVVVSCTGTFNGKTVEFGHVEQDVKA